MWSVILSTNQLGILVSHLWSLFLPLILQNRTFFNNMIIGLAILTYCGGVGTVSCVVSLLSAAVTIDLSVTSTKSSTSFATSKTSTTYSSLVILCNASIVLMVTLHRIHILSFFYHQFISFAVIVIMSYRLTKCAKQIFGGLNIFL